MNFNRGLQYIVVPVLQSKYFNAVSHLVSITHAKFFELNTHTCICTWLMYFIHFQFKNISSPSRHGHSYTTVISPNTIDNYYECFGASTNRGTHPIPIILELCILMPDNQYSSSALPFSSRNKKEIHYLRHYARKMEHRAYRNVHFHQLIPQIENPFGILAKIRPFLAPENLYWMF